MLKIHDKYLWDGKEEITAIDALRSKWEKVLKKSFDSLEVNRSQEFNSEQIKEKMECVRRYKRSNNLKKKMKHKIVTITLENFSDEEDILLDIAEDENGIIKVFGFQD